jgi:hypothetical protein
MRQRGISPVSIRPSPPGNKPGASIIRSHPAAIIHPRLRVREKLPKVENPSRDKGKGKGNEHIQDRWLRLAALTSWDCGIHARQREHLVTMLGGTGGCSCSKDVVFGHEPQFQDDGVPRANFPIRRQDAHLNRTYCAETMRQSRRYKILIMIRQRRRSL